MKGYIFLGIIGLIILPFVYLAGEMYDFAKWILEL